MLDYLIEVATLGFTTTVIMTCGVIGVVVGLYVIKSTLDFFRND